MGNASPIEIAWTFIALCGLVVQAWALMDVAADLRAIRLRKANGRLRMLVHSHLRSGVIFCCIHLFFLFAGVIAMLQPQSPTANTTLRIVSISLFMGAAVVLVGNGLLDRRIRIRLRSYPS